MQGLIRLLLQNDIAMMSAMEIMLNYTPRIPQLLIDRARQDIQSQRATTIAMIEELDKIMSTETYPLDSVMEQ